MYYGEANGGYDPIGQVDVVLKEDVNPLEEMAEDESEIVLMSLEER